MNWFGLLKTSQQKLFGYKIVAWDGQSARSLYDANQVINTTIGASAEMGGNGVYLGTSKKFCTDYYSGLTEDQDMLLTYSFSDQDIINGDPYHQNSEITVRQAILENCELLGS